MDRLRSVTLLAGLLCLVADRAWAVVVVEYLVVPEPATLTIVASGIVGLAIARKFRRRK